jgi:heterodisulfide reductase subunit B
MKIRIWIIAAFCSLALSSCSHEDQQSSIPIHTTTSKDFNFKFPSDLGPATVDVSHYPPAIQEDYKVFLAACSVCHTTARPLNSNIIVEKDWKRFVHRMHVKMENRGIDLAADDLKRIVQFLAYDSKIRKIQHKEKFQTEQKYLSYLFDELSKERERLIEEETKRLPKKETPYVGVK